ncbi:MAG: restriction endonuclease subunit S [Ramlibacter sp.]
MTTAQLGEISSIVRGIAFPKEDKRAEPLPGHVACLRTTNVQRTVEWDDLWFVPEKHVKREEQLVRSGDILISTANSYELVGKVAPVVGIPHKATLGAFISLIRPNERVEPKFLYHQLAWGKTQSRIRETASTTTNISNVSTKKLLTLEMFTPPLEAQREIVAELEKQFSRLDEAVANLQRVKANLKRYKASVLKAAVEGRLVETEGGWRKSTLGEEGSIIGGLTKNQKRNDLPLKLPYLRVANVYANELRLDEIEYIGVAERELEKLLVRKGDLLLVEGNGSPDQIGRVALWNDAIPNCVHQNHLIKARFGGAVFPEWALIWMLSPVGRHGIERVSASTSGLHTLSVGKVSRLPIGVPSLKEQVSIVAEVDRHLSIIREVETEVDTNLHRAQAMRQSTLHRAFTET